MVEAAPAVLRVDAGHGFCHPAFLLALPRFAEMAEGSGVAVLAIARSYSAGVVGWFVERLAQRGLVALAFANSSASIAPWGGSKALFGTNPIGFAAPRPNGPPIVVDMASSATARVNIVQAAARGEEVPPGWVFDSQGKPTTDPKALLAGGSVGPLGGPKGYGLALMVDILAAGLTGASWSHEASSFGGNEGGPPDVGQLFIALAPRATGGENLGERLAGLAEVIAEQPGARLPGDKRHDHRRAALRDGRRGAGGVGDEAQRLRRLGEPLPGALSVIPRKRGIRIYTIALMRHGPLLAPPPQADHSRSAAGCEGGGPGWGWPVDSIQRTCAMDVMLIGRPRINGILKRRLQRKESATPTPARPLKARAYRPAGERGRKSSGGDRRVSKCYSREGALATLSSPSSAARSPRRARLLPRSSTRGNIHRSCAPWRSRRGRGSRAGIWPMAGTSTEASVK